MAKPMIASPAGIGGKYFFFCSSVPKVCIISEPKLSAQRLWPHPGSTRQNSSVIRLCSRKPRPDPPYSSLMKLPMNPFLQARFHMAMSNSSFSSNSFARSLNSPSANSRAALTISFCSDVSSIFTPQDQTLPKIFLPMSTFSTSFVPSNISRTLASLQ
jgi:hypothetical protein